MSEQQALAGQVAWITGGGSGIGLAGAIELARPAAGSSSRAATRPSSTPRSPLPKRAARRPARSARRRSTSPMPARSSGSRPRSRTRYGHVDILVNSAGINFAKRFWTETDSATFGEVVAVNLNGATACTLAVLKGMQQRRRGTVINVASFAGWHLGYLTGPAYTASKAGMIALSHSFNIEECVNGLRATALCPGEVATPILKKRPVEPSAEDKARMLQEDDLGRTIRFIAELPPHVCINELVISPVYNRLYIGGEDLKRK